jgi:hypothetical protein
MYWLDTLALGFCTGFPNSTPLVLRMDLKEIGWGVVELIHLRINRLLDFVHRPVFKNSKN